MENQYSILETKLDELKDLVLQQGLSTKELLNVDEAAKYLSISKPLLYKYTSNRTIPFYRPGERLIYFKREELDKWVLSGRLATEREILAEV